MISDVSGPTKQKWYLDMGGPGDLEAPGQPSGPSFGPSCWGIVGDNFMPCEPSGAEIGRDMRLHVSRDFVDPVSKKGLAAAFDPHAELRKLGVRI